MNTPNEQRWIAGALKNIPTAERMQRKAGGVDNPFYLAELYHENSKYRPDLMTMQNPLPHYSTPDYSEGVQEFHWEVPSYSQLPPLDMPIGEVLQSRRSSWEFAEPIAQEQLWMLLNYSFGTTSKRRVKEGNHTIELRVRTYPSGGALYPIQIYLFLNRVEGMAPGLYRYSPFHNRLELLGEGEHYLQEVNSLLVSTDPNANPLYGRQDYSRAAVFCFLAADFRHQADKYRLRAYRLALLEAGHAAQNLCLVTTALGLTSVPLAGFYDDRANDLFQLDGLDIAMLYMLPIGKKSEG